MPAAFISVSGCAKGVLQYREPVDPSELLAGLTLEKLNAIYQSIIEAAGRQTGPYPKSVWKNRREEISLSDKMLEMKNLQRLTEIQFSGPVEKKQCSKVQVIVTFLSVLELIKNGTHSWIRGRDF